MMAIRAYLLSVCVVSLLTSILPHFLMDGKFQRVVFCVGNLVLLMAVLSPVYRIDDNVFGRVVSAVEEQVKEVESDFSDLARKAWNTNIKQRTEEYILDKASAMGLQLEVDVTVDESGLYPVPISASMIGDVADAQRAQLSEILHRDLGIELEAQKWRSG